MNNILVFFACVAAVTCKDVQVGSADHGRKIFDEKIQASPAIWRQVQKITINASNYEVISGVVVTDERPEKDGDAKIVEGGEGHKNVTIELQSPTVFRGFDFHVVVFAEQETVDGQHSMANGQETIDGQHPIVNGQETIYGQHPIVNGQETVDGQHPIVIAKDTDVNQSSKSENTDTVDSAVKDIKPAMSNVEEKLVNEGKPSAPVAGDQIRTYRNTQKQSVVDPIVQYVNDKTTEVPVGQSLVPEATTLNTQKDASTTDYAHKTNTLVTSTPVLSLENAKVNNQTPQTDKVVSDNVTASPEDIPQIKGQTTEPNFDSISKELGQKVVFGIKKH